MPQPASNTFTAFVPGEGEKTYTLLLSVTEATTDTCYVLYTDNTTTEDGSLCVFASIYEEDPLGPLLFPVESHEEWAFLERLIENLSASGEGVES